MDLIKIDGAYGEGGGQIIRSSLTMSALTGKPFYIENIRLHRTPKPYLRPQHLMAAKAVEKICDGKLEGAELNSKSFTFYPGKIRGGNFEFDIGTAGSVMLVAQAIIPVLLHSKKTSNVRIVGGTDLPKAPAFDYFQNVFLKGLSLFGGEVECKLIRPGYFPRGNGMIELFIKPSQLQGCSDFSGNENVKAIIRIANLPEHIAEREARILADKNISDITIYNDVSSSPGNTITIWQNFRGAISLGKRGKLAEIVATEAYHDFCQETAAVDRHLADQLLLYAAVANGQTRYSTSVITQHLLTNLYTIRHFLEDSKVLIQDNEVTIN